PRLCDEIVPTRHFGERLETAEHRRRTGVPSLVLSALLAAEGAGEDDESIAGSLAALPDGGTRLEALLDEMTRHERESVQVRRPECAKPPQQQDALDEIELSFRDLRRGALESAFERLHR